jgi:hypothetical protein
MKKLLISLLGCMTLYGSAYANDSKITKGYYTMDSMGCMILRECTDGVKQVFSLLDVSSEYPNTDDFYVVADEFNNMLVAFGQIGVDVFLADEKYFPVGHRGVYHTVSNRFFLNKAFMGRPNVLMAVVRHEGWHAAQDCMAGTIDNSLIAIIKPEEDVPQMWADIAKKTYMESSLPWEREAMWAGHTEGMTMKALQACAAGEMWKVYDPTPLTREYLVKEGYLDK